MVQMVGKYLHEKNENLDEYYKTVGVPYLARKMMAMSSPTMQISTGEDGIWTITTVTTLRTIEIKFKLGEEYEETMPGGVIKSTTTLDDNKLITNSVAPNGSKVYRIYEFSDTGCVINLKHEESGIEAKRHFKRA